MDGEAVENVLLAVRRSFQERGNAPTLGRPCTDEIVVHADDLAAFVKSGRDFLVDKRTGEIHQHVMLDGSR